MKALDTAPEVFASLARSLQHLGDVVRPRNRADLRGARRDVRELLEALLLVAESFGEAPPPPVVIAEKATVEATMLAKVSEAMAMKDQEHAKIPDVCQDDDLLSADDPWARACATVVRDCFGRPVVAVPSSDPAVSPWSRWRPSRSLSAGDLPGLTMVESMFQANPPCSSDLPARSLGEDDDEVDSEGPSENLVSHESLSVEEEPDEEDVEKSEKDEDEEAASGEASDGSAADEEDEVSDGSAAMPQLRKFQRGRSHRAPEEPSEVLTPEAPLVTKVVQSEHITEISPSSEWTHCPAGHALVYARVPDLYVCSCCYEPVAIGFCCGACKVDICGRCKLDGVRISPLGGLVLPAPAGSGSSSVMDEDDDAASSSGLPGPLPGSGFFDKDVIKTPFLGTKAMFWWSCRHCAQRWSKEDQARDHAKLCLQREKKDEDG
jgi:hypothetical protein